MEANEAPEKLYVDTDDRLSDSILYGFTEKHKDDDIEYIRKDAFIEKSAWSDNDEEMFCKALYFLDAGYNHFKCTDGIPECKDWLKSLKSRVQQKPILRRTYTIFDQII